MGKRIRLRETKNTPSRLNSPRMQTVSSGCRTKASEMPSHTMRRQNKSRFRQLSRGRSNKCIQERVPTPAWRSRPSWYLIAEENRIINPKTQHFMAKRTRATTRSLAVDHTPLLSAPQKVVDIIMEAKQAVSF